MGINKESINLKKWEHVSQTKILALIRIEIQIRRQNNNQGDR